MMAWWVERKARLLLGALTIGCSSQSTIQAGKTIDYAATGGAMGTGGVTSSQFADANTGGGRPEIRFSPCPPPVTFTRSADAGTCQLSMSVLDGSIVDPMYVNLVLDDHGVPTVILMVDGAGNCGSTDGWYYDDPKSPKTITLCPNTCDAFSNSGSRIRLVVGCPV